MSEGEWYVRIDGEVGGPYSTRSLRTMAGLGEILADDEVRDGLGGGWRLAKFIEGMRFAAESRTASPLGPGAEAGEGIEGGVVSLQSILAKHRREWIGINYRAPGKIEPALLLHVADGHFTVQGKDDGLIYHFPHRSLLRAVEAESGPVNAGGFFSRENYGLIVNVFHLVIGRGATIISIEDGD